MADLSDVSTHDLRAELSARKARDDAAAAEAFRVEHLCPECGGNPREFSIEMVEEFRFARTDEAGRPMLYAPYELGSTKGARYEETLTCENGHVTVTDSVRWFDFEEVAATQEP